ncbi:MAG: hypothetical protein OEW57_15455, partial [Gammaproteobacteria bacterium]|nr:hypothetical protein [Gammaproteobacteria bacterium]
MSKKRTNAVETRDASSYVEGMGRKGPTDAPVALRVTAANRGSTLIGHEPVDERSRADYRGLAPPLAVLDDIDLIVVSDALAAPGDSQQRLVRQAVAQPFDQARDRLGLVARRQVARLQLESARNVGHPWLPPIGL